ncbi:hypothetical protein O6H91_15G076400 [Diphasiastrum complanatum]|uniref:Uncharacterized protein n=1 Tax=Diphasiastrum complanatum TaxID=34168 RepID=A0ACC2BJW0_DIPCM|nr:hypothetical protein O6H91_15G076400 [Diphasiastrum complanatum]
MTLLFSGNSNFSGVRVSNVPFARRPSLQFCPKARLIPMFAGRPSFTFCPKLPPSNLPIFAQRPAFTFCLKLLPSRFVRRPPIPFCSSHTPADPPPTPFRRHPLACRPPCLLILTKSLHNTTFHRVFHSKFCQVLTSF